MTWIKHGKVQGGTIVFAEPLGVPEGTNVVVRIESTYETGQPPPPKSIEEFAAHPFFGMYADRQDMKDSVAWVRKERAKWHQRSQRQD